MASTDLFDPESFREEEFRHWFKGNSGEIRFYGHEAALKELRSRLDIYADSSQIIIDKMNNKTMRLQRI